MGVTTNRGRGRPPIGRALNIRLTPDQVAALDEAAGEWGWARADVIRWLVDEWRDALES